MPRRPPIWETHTDLSREEIKACERALRRRHPRRAYTPAIIGIAIALLAVPLTGLVVSRTIYKSGWIVYGFDDPTALSILTGSDGLSIVIAITVPALVGLFMGYRLYRHWMHPVIHDHCTHPRCCHCGYDLAAQPGHATFLRCPECGKTSPHIQLPTPTPSPR